MANRTEMLIAKFIQYRKIYEFIGCGEATHEELQEYISSLRAVMARSDVSGDMTEYSPLMAAVRPGVYAIDFDILSDVLYDFFSVFLRNLCSYDRVVKLVQQFFPEKIICDISEVELDKQSYRYLYEDLLKKYRVLEKEFYTQKYEYDDCQRQLASLNAELENIKANEGTFTENIHSLMSFVERLLHDDIYVDSVKAMDENGIQIHTAADLMSKVTKDDISLRPGIYNFQRPSWFTELHNELNKENVGKEAAKKTAPLLNKILDYWNDISNSDKSAEDKADAVDHKRQEEIIRLINNNSINNEEKYLKYILLTPGMSREYMKTLNGASKLGLSANVVIRLLEQSQNTFNKEIIEAYVSKTHKGLDYNLKQELAEELIQGKWSIRASVNGKEEIFQLAPMDQLMELAKQFDKICDALKKQNSSLRATMTRSEEDMPTNFDQKWSDILNGVTDKEKIENTEPDVINESDEPDEIDNDESDNDESEGDDFSGFDKEAF